MLQVKSWKQKMAGLGIWMGFVSLCLLSVSVSGLLQRLEHPVKADGSLSLVVIGDRGRKGTYNQSQVATQVFILYLVGTCVPVLV